ncbi:MAG: carotenoid biosynthesis protein [Sphingobacteriaceae bacterium]
MERAKGLKFNNTQVGILLIIIFHTVGLIGFFVPALQPLFIKLVPFHLLLMFFVIAFTNQFQKVKFAGFALLVGILGFYAEWIGVHTQWLFGDYQYGKTLGLKADDIPLLIGINWVLLVYGTGMLVRYTGTKNKLLRIVIATSILVLLDLLIEPVAIRFDYWTWFEQGRPTTQIPIKNYIDWFLVGFLLMTIFEHFRFEKQSRVGPVLIGTQFVFFIVLQWSRMF